VSAIFEFSVDHFATSLLQCSVIFVSVLNQFREISHFLITTVNSGILAIDLSHFIILSVILLQCSAIFATLLSLFFTTVSSAIFYHVVHFSMIQ
jgi:ABC-type thiamin/hydroxymethylpyrimidine transport system permease subunit